MGNVNKKKFESMEFITSPQDLIKRYHEMVSSIFLIIFGLLKKNAILRQTRDLLLPKLISGELDVSELDIKVPEETEV